MDYKQTERKRMTYEDLKDRIEIYADGPEPKNIDLLIRDFHVKGFTTNPSLMKKLGVKDYFAFKDLMLDKVINYPISFEIIADELDEMERQARLINGWGKNVYVKIPITNTQEVSTVPLIKKLAHEGIKINATAVFTPEQINSLEDCFKGSQVPSVVSVFAGRIANTGEDAKENVRYAVGKFKDAPNVKVYWCSTREVYNIMEAIESGAQVITMPESIIKEAYKTIGKDLGQYSRETVQMFRKDALESGYCL